MLIQKKIETTPFVMTRTLRLMTPFWLLSLLQGVRYFFSFRHMLQSLPSPHFEWVSARHKLRTRDLVIRMFSSWKRHISPLNRGDDEPGLVWHRLEVFSRPQRPLSAGVVKPCDQRLRENFKKKIAQLNAK